MREKLNYIFRFKNFEKTPALVKDPEWQAFCQIIRDFYTTVADISNVELLIDSSKPAN
jgi:hypothetical protein